MIGRFVPGAALLLLGGVAACDEGAFRQQAPARTSATTATTSTTTPADRAQTPAPTSNASWTAIARSPDAFELYPLRGALLVDAAGFLAVLGEGPLRQSPGLMRGLEAASTGRLYGAYPDAAWLVTTDHTRRWNGEQWVVEEVLREHETLLDLVAAGDGRSVAAIAIPGNDLRFAVLGDKPTALLAAAADAQGTAHDEPSAPDESEKEAPCKARMKARSVRLAALASGEVFAAGYTCEPLGHGGAIVERWAPGQERGTVDALPRGEGGRIPRISGLLARGPADVIVYGSVGVKPAPYFARFDGAEWKLEKAPFGGAVDTLAAADDGTLWAAAAGTVWRGKPEGWEEVPLPAGLVTREVWPHGAQVWVAAHEREGKNRAILLRTANGPAAEVVRLPPRNAMAGTIATTKRFFATAACDSVFAQLYAAGPSHDPTGKPLPPPKDFPTLKPLFAGELAAAQEPDRTVPSVKAAPAWTPAVDDDGDRFYVGIVAPSRDLARKLVAAYQEQNPSATPVVACHLPRTPRNGAPRARKSP